MATIDSENFACAHEQIVINRIILKASLRYYFGTVVREREIEQ